MSPATGLPVDRVDGPRKVTGRARYSAEIALPHLTHAVILGALIPSGRVREIDATEAERAAGVLAVLTHHNLPKIASQPPLIPSLFGHAAPGETFFPLQDATIHYAGQPVAIVIAESLQQAQHAATLVRVTYEETPQSPPWRRDGRGVRARQDLRRLRTRADSARRCRGGAGSGGRAGGGDLPLCRESPQSHRDRGDDRGVG
jgi:xanthine dehydrogenase molybdopterin-binding subunit B